MDDDGESEIIRKARPSASLKPSKEKSNELNVSDDLNSKEIQTGSEGARKKSKRKLVKKKIDDASDDDESTMFMDPEDNCLRHSFCVVESLKQKGVKPFKPKGLPWSSGRLLYLPGQRPPDFEKSKKELAQITIKQKKKKKQKLKEEKRIMKKLRKGDHQKLSNIINTSQELMILMRIIAMVMEKRKAELKQKIGGAQTDEESRIDEEEEEEEEEETDEGEGSEAGEDNEGGEEKQEGLLDDFNEPEEAVTG